MKQRYIIMERKRAVYNIDSVRAYTPEISNTLTTLVRNTAKRFAVIDFCIWDTSWLNEFTRHQSRTFATIIEIEKGLKESLFIDLKDTTRNEI